ncbi:DnaJ domain-containing protein [Tissierella sp. MSJ-40]|uniref:DnaJ domain-containing protein n=1 Tax=Tissierella simiarum TaxID=2841534 RepID=A0ABS6E4T9_9FIRM|nr:DnaJ domain-containing protein [Tissierella simiarum]MBU5437259.1 DnaJ domain-containing protein [Tissierella simiarum]
MNIFKKLFGKIIYGIGKIVDAVLGFFILIVNFIVTAVVSVGKGFLGFIGLGGLLFLFMLGPFGIALLLNPIVFLIIFLFVIVPILGTKLVSYLKYIRYMTTEFLFDHADSLIYGKKSQFRSFSEYGRKYKRMEEDRRRKEQQQRQAEQQRMWEEKFRQWHEYQNSQSWNNSYGGYRNEQTYANPTTEFKNKYEKSCDVLGVRYDADIYEIKLAYRKKAKEYHPDLNKSPNATELFQKVNDAYEFLSVENIERYKSIK